MPTTTVEKMTMSQHDRQHSLSRREWLRATAAGIAGTGFLLPHLHANETKAGADDPLKIGSRRELFVDRTLIESLDGDAQLQLQHPVPREVALHHDAAWEGTGSGYHSVFQDGPLYRMYYRGWHLELKNGVLSTGRHKPYACYAESDDGIHWQKPSLGIVDFNGSKQNNIVWEGVGTHNFSAFLDGNPNCPPEAKYKALAGIKNEGGLFVFQSADGSHWSLMTDKPVITDGAFDSQNLAFWDPTLGAYRAYWRIFTAGVTTAKEWKPAGNRAIRTAVSPDLINWSESADLTYEDSPDEQLYTNQVSPYYRAPHLLIGLPARYIERGWSESMKQLPDAENRRMRADVNERYGTGLTETLLMSSRDGRHFHRWNEAFLPPGIERPGTWQYGQGYTACHIVETKSSLPGAANELSFYSTEGYWDGVGSVLRRYTMRLDGFVAVSGSLSGGSLTTRPFTFEGSELELNFATSAAGSLQVEIQDAAGQPLGGFSLGDCPAHFGDSVSRVVTWNGGSRVKQLAGRPVRLKFVLRDADLYAFRFREA